MPMRPCDKCLENQWDFAKLENIVTATCRFCGHEVSWEHIPAKFRHNHHARQRYLAQRDARARGEIICRKCGSICERRTHDAPRPGKTTWYAWWFRCPRCRWLMMPAEAMRTVGNPHPLLASGSSQNAAAPDPNFQDDGVPPWE